MFSVDFPKKKKVYNWFVYNTYSLSQWFIKMLPCWPTEMTSEYTPKQPSWCLKTGHRIKFGTRILQKQKKHHGLSGVVQDHLFFLKSSPFETHSLFQFTMLKPWKINEQTPAVSTERPVWNTQRRSASRCPGPRQNHEDWMLRLPTQRKTNGDWMSRGWVGMGEDPETSWQGNGNVFQHTYKCCFLINCC